MSLTAQNMESRPGVMSHTIYRDLARMDQEQLGRYVQMVFTGQQDRDFLPDTFWKDWFDMRIHGRPGMDGRSPPSPAYFLSGAHNIIGLAHAGEFTIGNKGDEPPDLAFRQTYRTVISELLNECLTITGEPTDEQRRLASYVVEAVDMINSPEVFEVEYDDMVSQRRGKRKSGPIHHNYPQALSEDLEKLRQDYARMQQSVQQLIDNGRFGPLRLDDDEY